MQRWHHSAGVASSAPYTERSEQEMSEWFLTQLKHFQRRWSLVICFRPLGLTLENGCKGLKPKSFSGLMLSLRSGEGLRPILRKWFHFLINILTAYFRTWLLRAELLILTQCLKMSPPHTHTQKKKNQYPLCLESFQLFHFFHNSWSSCSRLQISLSSWPHDVCTQMLSVWRLWKDGNVCFHSCPIKVKKHLTGKSRKPEKAPGPKFRHHSQKAPTLLRNQGASESRQVQRLGRCPGDKVQILVWNRATAQDPPNYSTSKTLIVGQRETTDEEGRVLMDRLFFCLH